MVSCVHAVLALCLLRAAAPSRLKIMMHSEESAIEDDDAPAPASRNERVDPWEPKTALEPTLMPFIKSRKHKEKVNEFVEEEATSAAPHHTHPNDMFFPLVYRQNHINSMFKIDGNWYTWSINKHKDGTKDINYFICTDEPKHCDEIGWEDIAAPPKCAFQIDSLAYDDRACTSSFGAEIRGSSGGVCNGAEQTKVNNIVKSCGSRIRSLWRFVRAGRRAAAALKPADVNSLICEDEDECYVTVEYRIHHDRITFSLHEPTRGQTFKSALRRDQLGEREPTTGAPARHHKAEDHKKIRVRTKSKFEGKGIAKERNDSGYAFRRPKSKNRINDDISEDTSE